MKHKPIPYSFICQHTALSWQDTLWGYNHQLIGWMDVVAIAECRLLHGSESPIEIELALLGKSATHLVGELLRSLAINEPAEPSPSSDKKWLYLVLAWLYKNKNSIPDPLRVVEDIYADFDYPSEIESFVRYMPIYDEYDPSQHTTEDNEKRLFSNWHKYLISTNILNPDKLL